MMIKKLSLAIALALLAPQVFAAETSAPSGVYGGADIGYVWADLGAEEFAQEIANETGLTTTVTYDKATAIGRIFLGYNINDNVAVEVGYFGSGDLDSTYQVIDSLTISSSTSGVDYSILLRPSVADGMSGLFARFGGHYSELEANIPSYLVKVRGSGFLVGIGYDAPLDKNISTRISYTRYDSYGGVSDADGDVLTIGLLAKF